MDAVVTADRDQQVAPQMEVEVDAHFLCRYAAYYLTAPVQRPAADDPAPPAKVQLVDLAPDHQ